jgi:hypothetical protein
MPGRLVLLNEAEGPSFAWPRVNKADLSLRNQNRDGRVGIPGPAHSCLARSCAPDLYMCVPRCDRQGPALRFFIGTKRQNFLDTYDVRTNHKQPQRIAGHMPRAIPRVVDEEGE